jgi:large subunit ribosomal protein L24
MVARIKKNDRVRVLSGRDKGKEGVVIEINPKTEKVLVEGVALATRHVKPRRAGERGGIKKEESFIPVSNVMPVCAACKKPSRVNSKLLETGKKMRICNRCAEIF